LENTVLTLHIIACIVLVLLVLLQSGKEGMGVIFGGGSTSLFGSTGAGGILVKLTTIAALTFLGTSLGYNILSSAEMNKGSAIINIEVNDPSAPPKQEVPAGSSATPADSSTAPTDPSTTPADPSTAPTGSSTTPADSSAAPTGSSAASAAPSAASVDSSAPPTAPSATPAENAGGSAGKAGTPPRGQKRGR
jgi:preprotein translocase subunit SecG